MGLAKDVHRVASSQDLRPERMFGAITDEQDEILSQADVVGKMMFQKTELLKISDNRFQFDLTRFLPGAYVLHASSGSEGSQVRFVLLKK